MSKNAQITDYFASSKKPSQESSSSGRKRKLIVTKELAADPSTTCHSSDNIWSSSDGGCTSESSVHGCTTRKRTRIMAPKSRAQILVEMATSPKKGVTATRTSIPGTSNPGTSMATCPESPRRPVLTSPIKDPLHYRSLFTSPSKPVQRPVLSSPIKTMISSLNLSKPSSPVKPSDSCAYYKYRNLVDSGLVLPDKYRILVETFVDVDNILALILNRNEKATFDKLKSGVERKSGRRFDQNKLAMIKSVFDTSYSFKYEKSVIHTKDSGSKLALALIVTPVKMVEGKVVPMKTLTSSDISRRKIEFINILTDIVKGHHSEFLKSLDPPIILDDVSKIIRWHKNFDLNSLPDIEIKPYALPPPPVKADIGRLTAENFLKLTLKSTPAQRVSDSLASSEREPSTYRISGGKVFPTDEKVSTERTSGEKVSTEVSSPLPSTQSSTTSTIKVGALKGLPTALLEKIRAKESAKLALDMLRSPENEKKIAMIKSLPFYVRILLNYFIGEKKSVISLESVVKKIIQSYTTYISSAEVTEHLTYLSKLLPTWIMILEVKKGQFVKISDRDKKITDIENILENYKKRLEENTLEHQASLRNV